MDVLLVLEKIVTVSRWAAKDRRFHVVLDVLLVLKKKRDCELPTREGPVVPVVGG